MVDTLVSGASASRRVGSTPIMGTSLRMRKDFRILPHFPFYNRLKMLPVIRKNSYIYKSNIYLYEDCISGCGYDGRCFI